MSRGANIEARARALAERTLRATFGCQVYLREAAKLSGEPYRPPMTEAEIMAEVDRDWQLWAKYVEMGYED